MYFGTFLTRKHAGVADVPIIVDYSQGTSAPSSICAHEQRYAILRGVVLKTSRRLCILAWEHKGLFR